ncbi:MAG: hypothetical protein ACI3W5_00510, partial [Faecousia sp.]
KTVNHVLTQSVKYVTTLYSLLPPRTQGGECRGRCPHRPAESKTMLLRNCGESVTPQRADVGIGPYGHTFGAAVKSDLSLCWEKSICNLHYIPNRGK